MSLSDTSFFVPSRFVEIESGLKLFESQPLDPLRGSLLLREVKVHFVRRFGMISLSLGISVSAHAHTQLSILSQ